MNNSEIRPFQIKDIPHIKNILEAIGWANQYVQGQIDLISKLFTDPTGEIQVSSFEDKITGFIVAEHLKWNTLTHIHGLVVHPEYRRMKIGNKLVQSVLDSCKENGNRGIFLDTPVTNTEARVFYENIGMKEAYIMNEYYEAGLDGVTYQKLL